MESLKEESTLVTNVTNVIKHEFLGMARNNDTIDALVPLLIFHKPDAIAQDCV